MPHPLGHQRSADLDAVAQVDRLLPIKRKTVCIFGDGDIGEQPLRRQAAFDDVCRGQGLDHTVAPAEGVFGATRHDDPELRWHDIQPLGAVLADQDLFQTYTIIGNIRLDDFLDAFEMDGKPLTRPGCSFRLAAGGTIKLALDRREACLHLLESKGHLLIVDAKPQPFGALAVLRALQDLQDRSEIGDALISAPLDSLQPGNLGRRGGKSGLVCSLLTRHRKDHRLEGTDIIWQVGNGQNHAKE